MLAFKSVLANMRQMAKMADGDPKKRRLFCDVFGTEFQATSATVFYLPVAFVKAKQKALPRSYSLL